MEVEIRQIYRTSENGAFAICDAQIFKNWRINTQKSLFVSLKHEFLIRTLLNWIFKIIF